MSDAAVLAQGGPVANIGMGTIKRRRLTLPVSCHSGLCVGDCVPFYFCPRSIMLYVIHCANHPELAYRGGQDPIVHLEADLRAVVAWSKRAGLRWAFSLSNAGAAYTQFRRDLRDLGEIDWNAVAATDFRSPAVKEGKQAEVLVENAFPWDLVQRIGVRSRDIAARVHVALAHATHQPRVSVMPSWYY